MDSRIRVIQLTFLQRLISSDPSSLVKRIFIQRLYRCVLKQPMKGYIPDILELINVCELSGNLLEYVRGRRFPTKQVWKLMANQAVVKLDTGANKRTLTLHQMYEVICEGESMVKHRFYTMMQRGIGKQHVTPLLTMIRILSLPSTSYEAPICKAGLDGG